MWSLNIFALCSLLTVSTQAVSAPACQSIAPSQTLLSQVRTAFTAPLSGYPFGLVYAAEKDIAFVSLNSDTRGRPNTLGVLNTKIFPPVLTHEIPLNDSRVQSNGAFGLALSRNGKYLFVSGGAGAYIIDTRKAIGGADASIIGVLNGNRNVTGDGAIEVTLSLDGVYAFISQEYGSSADGRGNIDVFKLQHAANKTILSEQVGYIKLAGSVVGSSLSPDGKLLYVTSEVDDTNHTSAGLVSTAHGILSVLNVTLLTTSPSQAQISNVTAGCQPVREIVSSDGEFVWVTARASNHVLGFNASALVHDPANALLLSVQVGTSPVGLTFAHNEERIVTADSDRFNTTDAHTGLSIINLKSALSGKEDIVLGYIATGLFPREFATSHDKKTLLVADYSSKQIQAVDLTTLP